MCKKSARKAPKGITESQDASLFCPTKVIDKISSVVISSKLKWILSILKPIKNVLTTTDHFEFRLVVKHKLNKLMNTTTDMIAVNCFVFEVNQTLQAQNDNECVFDFKQDA